MTEIKTEETSAWPARLVRGPGHKPVGASFQRDCLGRKFVKGRTSEQATGTSRWLSRGGGAVGVGSASRLPEGQSTVPGSNRIQYGLLHVIALVG